MTGTQGRGPPHDTHDSTHALATMDAPLILLDTGGDGARGNDSLVLVRVSKHDDEGSLVMRYDALLKRLRTLEERYEVEVEAILKEFAVRDAATRERILATASEKGTGTRVFWQQTPEGRKKMRRMMKKRWKLKKQGH